MAQQIQSFHPGSNFKPERVFVKRDPKNWPIGRRALRRQFENRALAKLKINKCEIRIPGVCVNNIMLTWAHSRKSRFLLTSKDWQEAVRCCLPCHQILESMKHSEMKQRVSDAIKRRKN